MESCLTNCMLKYELGILDKLVLQSLTKNKEP